MSHYEYYRGCWPKKGKKKHASFSIRRIDNEWKVTVYAFVCEGMKNLLFEKEREDIVELVNNLKMTLSGQVGGSFFINEYRHLIAADIKSHYYFCSKLYDVNFKFEFEGKFISTKPVNENGFPLKPGDNWRAPIPGIPYVLTSGGTDIKGERAVFVDGEPNGKETIFLLECCLNKFAANENIKMVRNLRGTKGGRFYVNEHQAVYTPLRDDDGLNYVYCGQLNMSGWFPEPSV